MHLEHDPFEDWDGLSVYLITMSDIPVLQLTDQLTKESKTDSTNDMNDAPLLYCPINDDGNGDVEIAIVEGIKDGQSFEWKIVKGDKTEASGNLNKDNEYKATRNDLSVGSYELNVSEKGRHPRKINLVVFRVDMGRILKGAAEHKDKLVVGEDYIFEYTLEPSGITLPNLRFCIAHSVKSGSKGVRVHSADLKKVTSGLHTETWKNTKWTVTHDGAYANPKNGEYSA